MKISAEYSQYIEDQLKALGGVRIRKMFGGAGIFRDNVMFGLIADDVVYLKADEASAQAYLAQNMPQFQPYPEKPLKMPYWEVPAEVVEDDEEFIRWARIAFQVALKSHSTAAQNVSQKPSKPQKREIALKKGKTKKHL